MAGIRKVRGKSPISAEAQAAAPQELPEVIAALRKRFGNSTLFNASDKRQPTRIPSGCFAFDVATLGGFPRGKMSMIHGKRSSGKTSKLLKTIASAQRMYPDEIPVLIDAEHTYDPVWAEKLGVDNSRLLIQQPTSGEEAVDVVDAFMHTREVSLVGLDSIAALTPMKEIEESVEDNATPGIHAKLVTRMVRKLNAAFVQEYNRGHFPTFICLNQQRTKIGGWAPAGQDPLSLPGGQALEFFMGLTARIKNLEKMGKDANGVDVTDFNEHSFKIEKNKFNGGMRDGEYQLMRRSNGVLDEGDYDDAPTMLAFAKKLGVYTGGGRAWKLILPEAEHDFGKAEEAISFLYENPDEFWALRNHLIATFAASLNMPQYLLDAIYETPRCVF